MLPLESNLHTVSKADHYPPLEQFLGLQVIHNIYYPSTVVFLFPMAVLLKKDPILFVFTFELDGLSPQEKKRSENKFISIKTDWYALFCTFFFEAFYII